MRTIKPFRHCADHPKRKRSVKRELLEVIHAMFTNLAPTKQPVPAGSRRAVGFLGQVGLVRRLFRGTIWYIAYPTSYESRFRHAHSSWMLYGTSPIHEFLSPLAKRRTGRSWERRQRHPSANPVFCACRQSERRCDGGSSWRRLWRSSGTRRKRLRPLAKRTRDHRFRSEISTRASRLSTSSHVTRCCAGSSSCSLQSYRVETRPETNRHHGLFGRRPL